MGTLSPLAEEPISEEEGISAEKGSTFRSWLKNLQLFHRKPNLKVLLSVMACPLSPVSILPKQSLGVASSAEYIIRQFRATSGCSKMETNPTKSMYVAGRVAVAGKHGATSATSFSSQQGSFVMWQMSPTKWLLNLRVAGLHVSAGSDGHVAWRRTPWLPAHAAKGGVRPLRRALQVGPGWTQYLSCRVTWGVDAGYGETFEGQVRIIHTANEMRIACVYCYIFRVCYDFSRRRTLQIHS
ncbi:uncharacterized protein LOC110023783 [Phalaenopsis equestris]|uniref:uncharacterized protein LOC110023783 n=1 Tax=Phalaenopsis equestris TaxID=78828 RepID=UPI0009E26AF7|nr:uncharacterized protein LOC110023783 [Phalaenopsis equestris]